jgi:hypothetical protein
LSVCGEGRYVRVTRRYLRPIYEELPGRNNLWMSSASLGGRREQAAELAAGGVKRALLLVEVAMVNQRLAFLIDHIKENIEYIFPYNRERFSFRSRMISPPNSHR